LKNTAKKEKSVDIIGKRKWYCWKQICINFQKDIKDKSWWV